MKNMAQKSKSGVDEPVGNIDPKLTAHIERTMIHFKIEKKKNMSKAQSKPSASHVPPSLFSLFSFPRQLAHLQH